MRAPSLRSLVRSVVRRRGCTSLTLRTPVAREHVVSRCASVLLEQRRGMAAAAAGGVTAGEVEAAQRQWAEALIDIGKTNEEGGEARAVAEQHVDNLYDAFDAGDVLFKPTKATEVPFRLKREDALSYFVTGESLFLLSLPYLPLACHRHTSQFSLLSLAAIAIARTCRNLFTA